MNALALISRIVAPLVRATEGAFRPGPYNLPITGGWLPAGTPINFWQLGYDPIGGSGQSAMVEACISAYSQTIAMCPGDHWRTNANGGRERVTTSSLSRVLRHPNDYQSISDFMLNLTRSLYFDGNAYALGLRNDRFEIDELHLMDPRQCAPRVAMTGDVFYHLGGNDVIDHRLGSKDAKLIVPRRDVLHVRLHCDRKHPYPLVGETPLVAAMSDIVAGDAITQQQIQFYRNQARPSAVLSTDLPLDKDLVQALTDRWNEKSKGMHQGGTPVLTHGLKVQPWMTPGKDSQIAEVAKLSQDRIALAFRVPLGILGVAGTTYASTEILMQSWIATGLGFALNHIEEAFGLTFDLKGQPDEYLEFNTAALLRSAFKDRIEGLARAVQGGIYAPNEARALEDLMSVKFGDEPRVQQQVVPLSAAAGIPAAPAAPGPDSAAPALPKPAEPKPANDQAGKDYVRHVQRHSRSLLTAAARYQRTLA